MTPLRKNLLRLGVTMAAAGLSLGAVPAFATPGGPGVKGTIISQTTVGGRDYILRQITIPPGQSTGWHFHDGNLYGYVQQGNFGHFNADCGPDGMYKAGDTVTERLRARITCTSAITSARPMSSSRCCTSFRTAPRCRRTLPTRVATSSSNRTGPDAGGGRPALARRCDRDIAARSPVTRRRRQEVPPDRNPPGWC
jgi:quercetin dioxygenase-like cupin family protein